MNVHLLYSIVFFTAATLLFIIALLSASTRVNLFERSRKSKVTVVSASVVLLGVAFSALAALARPWNSPQTAKLAAHALVKELKGLST